MSGQSIFRKISVKFIDYWKQVGADYATVVREAAVDCKKKPWKAALSASLIGGLTVAYRTNPSYEEMCNDLAEKRQQMVLIPNSQHSSSADNELAYRSLLLCQDRLQYYNLWFFSLLVKHPHDSKVRIFHSQDVNLRKWYLLELYSNIFDIGYLGKWHRLEETFVDPDINNEEMNKLA